MKILGHYKADLKAGNGKELHKQEKYGDVWSLSAASENFARRKDYSVCMG
jgi:hypothetical protein